MKCSLCGRENPEGRFTCKFCGFPLRNIENLPPGEVLKGRFEILGFLGKGGMGVIYRARDLKLNRVVAVKILPLELKADEKARKRFLREAQAAARLEHPNICTIHEIYESDDIDFIVMPYIEGENLQRLLRKKGPFSPDEFLFYARQMASALAKAHSKGIIHRDIKPSNIMITRDGLVKILDFGLAKFTGAEESLTSADVVVGTLAYMSPEQCRGEKLTPASDVFSLGIVFYEMLTGENPFRGEDTGSTFYKLLHENPPPPSRKKELPPELDRVLMKALEKDPSKRYRDGSELLKALEEIQGGSTLELQPTTVTPAQPSKKEGSGKRNFLFLGLIFLLILAAGGIFSLLRSNAHPRSIIIRDFAGGEGVSSEAVRAVSFLLKKKLLLLQDVTVIDEGTFVDLRKRYSLESIFKKFRVIGIVSGSIKKYGKMISLEASLSKEGENFPITTSGEGESSILQFQVDSLGEKLALLLSLKFRRKTKVSTLTTNDYTALIYYIKAREEWEKVSVSNARRYLVMALRRDSDFPLAHFLYAKVLVFLDRIEEAKKQVELALAGRDRMLELDLWRAEALKAELHMKFKDKIKFLEKVRERAPYDKHSYYDLAEAYFHRASPRRAITYYQKALQLKADYLPVLNHLGYCYLYIGEHLKGIQYFEKYKLLSEEANAFDSLGDGYFYSGNYLEAITSKETALEKDPTLTWIYHSLAYILFIKGDISRAFNYNSLYLSRVKDKKSIARGYMQRAYFKMELGGKGAEEDIRKALSTFDPKEPHILIPELHWIALQVYLKAGKIQEACKHLEWMEKVVREYSVNEENYFPIYKYYLHGKAECLLSKGNRRGLAYYEKLMRIKEKLGYWATPFERGFFTGKKALAELKMGNLSRAETTIKDGFSYNPNHPLLLLARIFLLKEEGKSEEARRRTEELLSFYRSYPPADRDFLNIVEEKIRKAPGGI